MLNDQCAVRISYMLVLQITKVLNEVKSQLSAGVRSTNKSLISLMRVVLFAIPPDSIFLLMYRLVGELDNSVQRRKPYFHCVI